MRDPRWPGIDLPEVGEPTRAAAEEMAAEAWAYVRGYTRQTLTPVVGDTVVLDGTGGGLIVLPEVPVTAVTELLVNERPVTDPEWSADGLIRVPTPRRYRAVKVTYDHGYALDSPAIIELGNVAAEIYDRNSDPLLQAALQGVTQQIGPYSFAATNRTVAIGRGLSAAHQAVLDRYVVPLRGVV